MERIRESFICTKYNSLQYILNILHPDEYIYNVLNNVRKYGWQKSKNDLTPKDTLITNLVKTYDLDNDDCEIYYRMVTPNVIGNQFQLQFAYNKIFIILVDNTNYTGFVTVPVNLSFNESALFIIIGIKFFLQPESDDDLKLIKNIQYNIMRILLPFNPSFCNILSYFTCLDILLPIAISLPPDLDYENDQDQILYNFIVNKSLDILNLVGIKNAKSKDFFETIMYLSKIANIDLSCFDMAEIDFDKVINSFEF